MPRDKNNTWTSDAIERGDIGAIREKLLDDPGYIHERDYVGNTPLLTAIEYDIIELVRLFLEHGADPNVEVDDGYTCLLTAIESEGDTSAPIVAELIRVGADIHRAGIHGWTPLHMAAARGQVEKARLLIDMGADVNRRIDIDGLETPLMEAAHTGHPSTVRLLLEHGADPTMRDTMNERTPLEIAENTSKGPDPGVIAVLREEDIQVDFDDMFGDMDLEPDQLEVIKQSMEGFDMAQNYIDNSKGLVERGNHAEVIRILAEHLP
ncbi:ankyrin repeat domain-containing protein [Akkermansiaceae bacterium]|nr:ankyrin repeat domain-containing protein [Akkermansiaceae bacterium]